MTHPEPRNTSDLKAAIRQSLELLDGNPTPKAAVLRTLLWAAKAQLTLEAANYKRLENIERMVKLMAATVTDVQNALTTLDGDVDQLIAQHAQSLDGVLAQANATDAKVKAALTPAAPTVAGTAGAETPPPTPPAQ